MTGRAFRASLNMTMVTYIIYMVNKKPQKTAKSDKKGRLNKNAILV
jgi:hypothetical protein